MKGIIELVSVQKIIIREDANTFLFNYNFIRVPIKKL